MVPSRITHCTLVTNSLELLMLVNNKPRRFQRGPSLVCHKLRSAVLQRISSYSVYKMYKPAVERDLFIPINLSASTVMVNDIKLYLISSGSWLVSSKVPAVALRAQSHGICH